MQDRSTSAVRRAVTRAGLVFGLGVGGFLDGIVLHMLLQWHHLLCFACQPEATAAEVRRNVYFDGWFHVATLALTIAGVALLWRALRAQLNPPPVRVFLGAAVAGWGVFNLVEGIIDHELLGIHHVRPGPHYVAWDIGFLVVSVVLVGIGWAIGRERRSTPVRWGSPQPAGARI
jgi:uncharacterized membrane protein